jgi:nitrate reductase NapE component
MAVAASVAALRARAVPTWVGWLSLVVGAAAVATVAFVGIFAWLAWLLVVSVLLLVRRA